MRSGVRLAWVLAGEASASEVGLFPEDLYSCLLQVAVAGQL